MNDIIPQKHIWTGKPSQLKNIFPTVSYTLLSLLFAVSCRYLWRVLEESFEPVLPVSSYSRYFIGASVLVMLFPLLKALWLYILTASHKYQLSNIEFIEESGVFNRRIDRLKLFRVKDIELKQSFSERLFQLSTIVLYTSDTTTPMVRMIGIEGARTLVDRIQHFVDVERRRNQVREIDYQTVPDFDS